MKTRLRSSKWLRCELKVINILEDFNDWVELREIAYQLNMAPKYIGGVLRTLLTEGKVERQRCHAGHLKVTQYRLII